MSEPVLYFKKWKTQVGTGIHVIPKLFLSYYGSKFTINDKEYIGQKWKCKMPNGKYQILILRVPYIEDKETTNIGNNIYESLSLNYLLNTPDEFNNPTLLYSKKESMSDDDIYKIKILKKLRMKFDELHEGAGHLINFIKSPSYKTKNAWINWKKRFPKQYNLLIREKNESI